MSLSNRPIPTKMQVGETAYWLSGGEIKSAAIEKITVEVSDPNSNSTALQVNTYKLAGTADNVPESKIFHSKNALLYSVKGTYLNKWTSATFQDGFINKGTSNDWSYSDFQGVDLSGGGDLSGVILDGCNLASVNLGIALLSGASLKYAILTGATLTGCDFSNANLTGATMPTNADSKSEFKALVGSYTGCKWVDGTTVT